MFNINGKSCKSVWLPQFYCHGEKYRYFPCVVASGSALHCGQHCWINLWAVGNPSLLSQCTRKLWAPKCSPNPCLLRSGKQQLGILVTGPLTNTKVSFVAFLGWVQVPSGSTQGNSSSLLGLQSMVIIHLLN